MGGAEAGGLWARRTGAASVSPKPHRHGKKGGTTMAQVPATRSGQGGPMAARREHPLQRMHRDFETLFHHMLGGWLAPLDPDLASLRAWDFDVKENDQEITVRA